MRFPIPDEWRIVGEDELIVDGDLHDAYYSSFWTRVRSSIGRTPRIYHLMGHYKGIVFITRRDTERDSKEWLNTWD